MEYLKDKSYYEELYDKITVDDCRLTEKSSRKTKEEDIQKCVKLPKGYSVDGLYRYVNELILYFKKGDRYTEKESTIREWMEKDKERDEFYNQPELLAYCPKCNQKMALTFKHLEEKLETQKMKILYLFQCEKCDQKRGVYDNGEPYVFKNDLCPNCKTKLEIKTRETKNKVTIKSNCIKCGYDNVRSYDLDEKPKSEEVDLDFEKDKARFCLSEEEGEKYRSWRTNFNAFMEHQKDKETHKEAYEKAQRIKILTIAQLSDLLSKELSKEKFGGLMISSPEIGRDLIVDFNIQDTTIDRSGHDAKRALKKLLNDSLQNTNWHLMSEGLKYQLGILSGRLKGQDSQEHIYDDLKSV